MEISIDPLITEIEDQIKNSPMSPEFQSKIALVLEKTKHLHTSFNDLKNKHQL